MQLFTLAALAVAPLVAANGYGTFLLSALRVFSTEKLICEGYGDASSASSLPATATIDIGTIAGTTTSLASATAPVNKFLGIPFAQSPPERFSPPTPPAPLSGTLQTQQWKDSCVQQFAGAFPLSFGFSECAHRVPGLVYNVFSFGGCHHLLPCTHVVANLDNFWIWLHLN